MRLNAYQMMQDVRDSINEATAAHWSDLAILRKLNKAQAKVAMQLSMSIGDWLLVKTTIAVSNNLVELPLNCAKPVYVEDAETGAELPFVGSVRERNYTRSVAGAGSGAVPDIYLYGNYIELNSVSYSGSVNLWYERTVPDLHFGTAGSGSGSNTLVFQASNQPVLIDDYYKDVYVEVISGTGAGTRAKITAYTGSTGTATVSGTFGTTSVYGTETVLPEVAIPVIVHTAVVDLLAKPSAAIDPRYFEYAKVELKDAVDLFEEWITSRVKNRYRIYERED